MWNILRFVKHIRQAMMMKKTCFTLMVAATLLGFGASAQKDSAASLLELSGAEVGSKFDWISERKTAYSFSVGASILNFSTSESVKGSDDAIKNFVESYTMGYSAQFAFQYPVTKATYFKGAFGYQQFLGDNQSKATRDSAGQKVTSSAHHDNFGIVSFSAIYGAKFMQTKRFSPFAEIGLTYLALTNRVKSRWEREDAASVTLTSREYFRSSGLGLQAALGAELKISGNWAIQVQGMYLAEITDGGSLNTFTIRGFEGSSLSSAPQTSNTTFNNLAFGNIMGQIGVVFRP